MSIVVLVVSSKISPLTEPVIVVQAQLQPEVVCDAAKFCDGESGDAFRDYEGKDVLPILFFQPTPDGNKQLQIADGLFIRSNL